MGYTRYWTQARPMTQREWARLRSCFEGIQLIAGVDLAGPHGTGRPVITRAEIAFNGARDAGEDYETFALYPGSEHGRGFCKTYHRPYDVVVAAVLTAADRIAPGAFSELTADGGPEDWAEADAICDYLGLPRRKRIAARESVMAKAMDCVVRYTGSGIFDVDSPSGSTYTVSVGYGDSVEHWDCTCPWQTLGDGRCCAHVQAVEVWLDQESIALSEADAIANEERESVAA